MLAEFIYDRSLDEYLAVKVGEDFTDEDLIGEVCLVEVVEEMGEFQVVAL